MNAPVRLRSAAEHAQALADACSDGIAEGERRATAQWIETLITYMRTGRLIVRVPTGGSR